MWLIYMMFPEVNTVRRKEAKIMLAQGLVRISKMQVGHAKTERDARRMCIELALKTLQDHKMDTTVVGFGFRNYYSKKKELVWQMSITQLVDVLIKRNKKAA